MNKLKEKVHEIREKFREGNERGARQGVIEELFYDFNRSRVQVYKMNFVRGLLFGMGSVIGGTVGIALIVWVLSMLANIIPPLDDLFSTISQIIEGRQR